MRRALVVLTFAMGGCSALYPFAFDGGERRDGGVVDSGVDAGAPDAGGTDAGQLDGGAVACAAPPTCSRLPPSHSAPAEPPCPDGFYHDLSRDCLPRMEPLIGHVCFEPPPSPVRIDCTGTANERWDALVAALAAIDSGGGRIELGPCDFVQPAGGLRLSFDGGPLVLEGAGPQLTALRSTCGGCTYAGLQVRTGPIVLRDLTIEVGGPETRNGLDVDVATDVLLERVHVLGTRAGARVGRVTNLVARDLDLQGTTAGALVINSSAEGFMSFTGTRFAAQRSMGAAALDIRGVRDVEIAGCELADAVYWMRARSLDRAWIHDVQIENAGPAVLDECDSAPLCVGEPLGDVALHDLAMEPGQPHVIETRAQSGRLFVFRVDGPSTTVSVPGGRTDVYTCAGEDLQVSDPERQQTFDCAGLSPCTTRVFLTP